jgi:invasion protein IalB
MIASNNRNVPGRPWTLRAFALILAFFAMSYTDNARAQEITHTFDDWSIACQANQAGQQECLMFQDIAAADSEQSIMRLTVIKAPRTILIITTPLGVMLPPGLVVTIDQQEVSRMNYQICIEPGCQSQTELTPELVQRLKGGVAATVTVVGPNGQPIAVPVSLKGFTAAYDTLT